MFTHNSHPQGHKPRQASLKKKKKPQQATGKLHPRNSSVFAGPSFHQGIVAGKSPETHAGQWTKPFGGRQRARVAHACTCLGPPPEIDATRQRRGGASRRMAMPRGRGAACWGVRVVGGAVERSGTQACAEKAGGGRVPSLSARSSPRVQSGLDSYVPYQHTAIARRA